MEEIATQLRELADEIEAEQETEEENDLPEFSGYQMAEDLSPADMYGSVYLDGGGDIWIDPEGDDVLCLAAFSERVVENMMEALDAE